MESWAIVDASLVVAYGLQHTLLTTKTAVGLFNRILPAPLWNACYSALSIAILVVMAIFWERCPVVIYHLHGVSYWLAWGGMAGSVFMFMYCFKYTTSFWQWIGIAQIAAMIKKTEGKPYYRVRKNGLKRYIRFPHHLFLVTMFWSQPVMTLDTLLLAVLATIYTYIGTLHQDSRGRRLLGDEWIEYSRHTGLMFPNLILMAGQWRSSGRIGVPSQQV